MRLALADSAATEAAGTALAQALPPDEAVIYLQGDLGAGKTTLVRGILHGLGHGGRVPSPTYTLVEPYEVGERRLTHMDLYRIADPEELAYLGVRDLGGILLVEWPERGSRFLPPADITLRLSVTAPGRLLETQAFTPRGLALEQSFKMAASALS